MNVLPIYFDVRNKPVAVVGGGTVASRKAEMALRAGATVTAYAAELGEDFRGVKDHPNFRHQARAIEASDVDPCALVYCAVEDQETAERVHALAKAARVPVNVADNPPLCDFSMPTILDRSPVVVAIGTEGASPILGRMLKARLEAAVPASYGRLAAFVRTFRDALKDKVTDGAGRRRFWERIMEGPVAEMVLAGKEKEAEAALNAAIEAEGTRDTPAMGEVYLVGAGPGDPDLLTFRALRLMQKCDVVLYDRLVSDGILNLVRRDSERIYVGKQRADHALPQEDISSLLVTLARQGKRVLRLKGGDPFIFGRGGEEIEMLAAHHIPFQVVPGVTAAAGCGAYSGIPLTHRDHAHSCLFVTGHGKDGDISADWTTLIQPRQTVAIYMGLAKLERLTADFIAHGADPQTPAAIIENGTRENQRVVVGTIRSLVEDARREGLKGPTIIIIGSVVTLRDKLNWFASADRAQFRQAATA